MGRVPTVPPLCCSSAPLPPLHGSGECSAGRLAAFVGAGLRRGRPLKHAVARSFASTWPEENQLPPVRRPPPPYPPGPLRRLRARGVSGPHVGKGGLAKTSLTTPFPSAELFFSFDRTRDTMDVDAAPPSPGGAPVDTYGAYKRR